MKKIFSPLFILLIALTAFGINGYSQSDCKKECRENKELCLTNLKAQRLKGKEYTRQKKQCHTECRDCEKDCSKQK